MHGLIFIGHLAEAGTKSALPKQKRHFKPTWRFCFKAQVKAAGRVFNMHLVHGFVVFFNYFGMHVLAL